MPNVLIFESDQQFASNLQTELTKRSCAVSIVEDATVGLQQAASSPPDLILLCTELPRMNGFSVCNRLKRDPSLQTIPVIIMSSSASEETFEQHRKLPKKRANDYVHKPISFSELLPRIQELVPLPGSDSELDEAVAQQVEELEAVELIEEEELVEPISSVSPESNPNSAVDETSNAELEAFTEEAFEALIDESIEEAVGVDSTDAGVEDTIIEEEVIAEEVIEQEVFDQELAPETAEASALDDLAKAVVSSPSGLSNTPPRKEVASTPAQVKASSAPPPFSHRSNGASSIPPSSALPSLTEATTRPSAPSLGNGEEKPQLKSALDSAQLRIAELEAALDGSAREKQKVEELHQALDEANARLSSGGGGNSARDVLDLREALNKKEKELLDLRDELTRKEKEVLALKNTCLEWERKQADSADKLVEIDKKLHASERAQEAAVRDRDQATKRANDHKRKADKLVDEVAAAKAALDASQAELKVAKDGTSEWEAQVKDLKSQQYDLQKRLGETEEQLDQSQLQASEALDKLDKDRTATTAIRNRLETIVNQLADIEASA